MAVSNPQSNMGAGGCSALEPYALQVTGDSMAPEFWDGCVIIVEPGGAVRNGSFVIVDYAGDTLFRDSIGRTDLPGGNPRQILRSIEDQLLHLPEETIVVPGHGPNTTIGREKERNPFLQGL